DLHARRPNVDAIDGRPVDLCRRVETLRRRADELEVARLLERHAFRNRQPGSIGGKLTIFDASTCRRVKHFAALRTAGCRIAIPPLCCRRDEHASRSRSGLTQRLPCPAYRI